MNIEKRGDKDKMNIEKKGDEDKLGAGEITRRAAMLGVVGLAAAAVVQGTIDGERSIADKEAIERKNTHTEEAVIVRKYAKDEDEKMITYSPSGGAALLGYGLYGLNGAMGAAISMGNITQVKTGRKVSKTYFSLKFSSGKVVELPASAEVAATLAENDRLDITYVVDQKKNEIVKYKSFKKLP